MKLKEFDCSELHLVAHVVAHLVAFFIFRACLIKFALISSSIGLLNDENDTRLLLEKLCLYFYLPSREFSFNYERTCIRFPKTNY